MLKSIGIAEDFWVVMRAGSENRCLSDVQEDYTACTPGFLIIIIPKEVGLLNRQDSEIFSHKWQAAESKQEPFWFQMTQAAPEVSNPFIISGTVLQHYQISKGEEIM